MYILSYSSLTLSHWLPLYLPLSLSLSLFLSLFIYLSIYLFNIYLLFLSSSLFLSLFVYPILVIPDLRDWERFQRNECVNSFCSSLALFVSHPRSSIHNHPTINWIFLIITTYTIIFDKIPKMKVIQIILLLIGRKEKQKGQKIR